MPGPSAIRLGGIVVLLGVLGGLAVWFGAVGPNPSLGAYPGTDELAADYEAHRGEPVRVGGRVVRTDPVVIETQPGTPASIRVTITGLSVTPATGDHLAVFGTAEADRTIRAARAYRVPPSGRWYAYGVSFLAGVWVLGRLVRRWTINAATLTIKRRPHPLPIPLIRGGAHAGEERNA